MKYKKKIVFTVYSSRKDYIWNNYISSIFNSSISIIKIRGFDLGKAFDSIEVAQVRTKHQHNESSQFLIFRVWIKQVS